MSVELNWLYNQSKTHQGSGPPLLQVDHFQEPVFGVTVLILHPLPESFQAGWCHGIQVFLILLKYVVTCPVRQVQDHPFCEHMPAVYDTRSRQYHGRRIKRAMKMQRRRMVSVSEGNNQDSTERQWCSILPSQGFHGDSGPQGFLPFLNSCNIHGLHYLMMMMMMMIRNSVYEALTICQGLIIISTLYILTHLTPTTTKSMKNLPILRISKLWHREIKYLGKSHR